jgi:membrane protein implicated in regulation of membrane protease activity
MTTRGLLIVALFIVILARPALAYLDAGSGSMLLQLLLGGFAGLAVIVKLYWRRLLAVLGIRREDPIEAARGEDAGDGR